MLWEKIRHVCCIADVLYTHSRKVFGFLKKILDSPASQIVLLKGRIRFGR